eukprot:CAMPEP_0116051432 /NCGR_PEP_ID=MMETSP0322-20121206/977_1 /TAXON_ID=163516 /ORGANISM="Leptocylindrus danicus var. apora, Strain B651" /LENGTH=401 /DNA_ID=CAMNT_0003534181 /DNA_START=399 /DNA_END=1604 /DNA_ORIENTATION=+
MPTRMLQKEQNRNDDDDDLSLQNDSDPFAAPGHTYSIVVSIVLVVIVCICFPLAYKARRASREEDRRRGGRRGGGVEEDYEYYGGGDDGDTNHARVDDGSASYGRRERRKYARKVLEERRRVVDKALFSERFVVMRQDVMCGAGLTEIEEEDEEGEGSEVEEDIELCIHKGLEDVAISELETVVMSGLTMDESDNNGKSNDEHDVETGNITIHNVSNQETHEEKEKVESSSVVKGQSSSPSPSPSFSLNHRRSVGCCPICLVDYIDGDEICRSKNTACSHIFHRRCITEWLLLNDECPCCRAPYIGNIPGGTAMSREARQILREVARDRRQNNSRSGRRRNRRSRISSSALSQEQNVQDYNNDNGIGSSGNNNTVNGQPSHNFRPLTVTTQSSRLRQPRES